jgi:hypothetical protein
MERSTNTRFRLELCRWSTNTLFRMDVKFKYLIDYDSDDAFDDESVSEDDLREEKKSKKKKSY